ncbi:MAG: hypothetical protein K2J80_02235 [Oscillospiraceae bacterium]|nr:hypothetical protein [Oscillospiraceae bacterium]
MSIKSTFEKHIKLFKAMAAIIAFVMIAGLLWFAFALNGNPVSYALAKNNAETYVEENYHGYVVNIVAYNFKFGHYTAEIVKPDSEDCHFTASFGLDGKCLGDNYDSSIVKGYNTMARLNMRYRELVNTVLKSPAYPFESKIAYGVLVFEDDEDEYSTHDFSLPKSILQPDSLYDINALAENGGLITVYVASKEKSPERAAEVLLELDRLMKQGGVPFYAIDLILTAEDGDDYFVDNFHRADIYETGLVDRVRENHRIS